MTQSLRFATVAALLASTAAVHAAPIGQAETVTPSATVSHIGGSEELKRGAKVEDSDVVRTGPTGKARIRFVDASTIDVSPSSEVTLDKFVYSGSTASQATLSMARGALRWVSGRSPKDAYGLTTPTAMIGVRGTVLRLSVDPSLTTVRLDQGAATACSRISRLCGDVDAPGQGVRLFADGRVETFGPRVKPPYERTAQTPTQPSSPSFGKGKGKGKAVVR